MHFRQILISCLVIGAAMFIPGNVFAEKNEHSGQQNSQKTSGQVQMDNQAVKPNILAKEKTVVASEAVKPNVSAQEKAVVVPDSAIKNQGGVKQQPSKVSPNNSASQKAGAALQHLPDPAKGNGKSAVNKTVKAHESKKRTAVQEKNDGLGRNAQIREREFRNIALDTVHDSETRVNTQNETIRVETQGENTHLSENHSESLVSEPQEKGNIPSDERKIPKVVKQIPNPTQRTSGHEGPPTDRVSQGLSTNSFLDKWFTWNSYYEIQLVQSYLSQEKWLNNQWVNAPPSPPPQEALF
ncbi:hypothetical protein [Bacillus sp. B15-48]|uniref:hypothetical protein n=1 Tax=Bacillus sp. B15-48 TaxID=1548601 RepID=UPI0019400DB3|nr:hypothetical protein [Bacillus sp. B15-48]MBM4761351.1 hypothetical protein [Bacillus sp. B15-48]